MLNRLKPITRGQTVKVCPLFLCKNQHHPSNGWFGRGYKPLLLGQRLKALAFAFRSSHFALHSSLPLKGRSYYFTLTLKRVLPFFLVQSIHCYIMFLLFLNVFLYGGFIEPYCAYVVSLCPKMSVSELIF